MLSVHHTSWNPRRMCSPPAVVLTNRRGGPIVHELMPDRDEIRGSIVLLIAAAAIAWCDVTAAASPDDAPPMVQRSPQVSISYAESSAPMIVTARSGSAFPSPFMPVTAVNFLGQGHTLSSGTQTGTPPDPNGAAGPDRYVQVVNGGIAIWDKTGAVVASSQFLNTLWSGYVGTNAGNACATSKDGDPIVLYDQLAD